MRSLTYSDAGVDIDAGNELVRRIAPLAARTRRAEPLPTRYRNPFWWQVPMAWAPSCGSPSTTAGTTMWARI